MSGSGNPTETTWAGNGGGDECDFELETTLRAPEPDGVAAIAKGQKLDVVLDEDKPAIEVMKGTQRVGSIVERVPRFVNCIRQGAKYVAEVVSIDEGNVIRVRTHPS